MKLHSRETIREQNYSGSDSSMKRMEDRFFSRCAAADTKKRKNVEQLRSSPSSCSEKIAAPPVTAVDETREGKENGRKRRWRFTLLIRRLGAVLSSVCSRGEHLNSALPPLRRTLLFLFPPALCSALLGTRQRKTRLESTGKLNSFVKTSGKGGGKRERERKRDERGERQENACTNCGCRQKSRIRVDVETGGSSRGKGGRRRDEKSEGAMGYRERKAAAVRSAGRGGENT